MTQKELRVLEALLQTSTRTEAAKIAGVNRETVAKLLARPDFREEYNRRREDMIQASCSALQASMLTAVQVLVNIMQDKGTPAGNRITAAKNVLEYGVKLTEQIDLLDRLEALERIVKEGER